MGEALKVKRIGEGVHVAFKLVGVVDVDSVTDNDLCTWFGYHITMSDARVLLQGLIEAGVPVTNDSPGAGQDGRE